MADKLMGDIWVISDTHFGHANCFAKFKVKCAACGGDGEVERDDSDFGHPTVDCAACAGTGEVPMRPFTSVKEMDETMVERWNKVVKPNDKVYHLGDIIVRSEDATILGRLNGKKRAVLGNHDTLHPSVYAAYFEKVMGARDLKHVMLTHVPIHPRSFEGKIKGNIHGHIHNNDHRLPTQLPCPPYLNVCVEVIDYTPMNFDEARKKLGLT